MFSKYNSRPCIYGQMSVFCSPEESLNLGENRLLSVNVTLKLLDIAEVRKITSGFIYQQVQTAYIQRWALPVLIKCINSCHSLSATQRQMVSTLDTLSQVWNLTDFPCLTTCE